MAMIFLFGTLRHPALFEVVAGQALSGCTARLPGHRVALVAGETWPVLTDVSPNGAASDAGAEGLLVTVPEDAAARMDFYEACFGYRRGDVTVLTADGRVSASVWRPETALQPAPGDWDLATWVASAGAVSVAAAVEVMRQYGREDPGDVARRFGMIRGRAQAGLAAGAWRRPGVIGRAMTRADVRIADRDHVYDGFQTTEIMHARFRTFGGAWSDPVERVVTRISDAVTVLPYDPVRDRVLLVEQVRFGALGNGDAAPWLLEPVAGMIDAGETPEQSARRETLEEAGLDLGTLHFVARYYPSPGGVAQVFHSYVAEAALPDVATGFGGSPAEHEDILSHVVPFDLARAAYDAGDMANAALLVSFQWLMLNRDRLRRTA